MRLRLGEPERLAAAWRAARPFPHLVLDDVLDEADLQALREAVAREPHFPNSSDFFEFMASKDPMRHPVLESFRAALEAEGPALAPVTAKPLGRLELVSYVYLAGSFLLAHNDHAFDASRLVACVFYLLPRTSSTGGELDLYECSFDGGDIVAATPTVCIQPEANRLVLFEVSPGSLHQVREVTGGGRVSLSGWFYP